VRLWSAHAAALHRLRAAAVPLALVTNTTSRTRASIARALAEAGFPVTADDILTAPVIAAARLQEPAACAAT
jgi:ribonucleotide monophosphatase NagD (HAD superfamily)